MAVIKYFLCPIPSCKASTGFDTSKLGKDGESSLTCSSCKKKWIATKMPACCGRIEILFVSVESGSKKPLYSLQSLGK